MRLGVMISNGPGGHPPWKHAEVTASKLIIDPLPENDPDGLKTEAAETLRHAVKVLLEERHEAVRDYELSMLDKFGAARHSHPLKPEEWHVEEALASILAATRDTVLEAHYSQPAVQEAMREVIAHEFRTQQYIHREWRRANR